MKLKKILALAVCLAMVLSVVPAFSLTASAAEETVLFDVSTFGDAQYQGNGDATGMGQFGWTGAGAVNFNKNWTDGVWGSLSTQDPALMFFRAGARGQGGDESPEATINNANDTMGAGKLVISFDYAAQDTSNLYQEWLFKDLNGNTFARIFSDIGDGVTGDVNNAEMHFGFQDGETTAPYPYIARAADSRARVQAMRGKNITITVEKASEGYSVSYGVEGEDTAYTQTVEAVNGFKSIASSVYSWNDQYAAMGLQNLKITYVPNTTLVDVTVTYKVGDAVVATETGKYDSSTSEGLALPEKFVLYDGDVYRADAVTATGNMEIPMTVVPRYASKEVDEEFTLNNKYTVTGGSIVVNGDFKAGTAGWTNRSLNTEPAMSVVYDETIGANTMQGKTEGASAANSIGTEWKVEVGKTYYASMMVKTAGIDANNHRFNRLVNMPKDTAFDKNENAELDADIIRFGKEVPKDNTWKKFEAVFTATNEAVTLLSSWVGDISFANIEILPVEMAAEGTPAKVTVTAGENVYTAYEGYVFAGEPVTAPIAAQNFASGGKLYSVEAQDVTLTEEKPEVNLTAEVIGENVAKSVKTTTGSATRWPTDNDYLTAVGGGSLEIKDDDGASIAEGTYSQYSSERRLTLVFDKPTLEDKQEAVLHLAVGGVRRNNSAGKSATFRAQLNADGKSAYTTGITDYNNGTVVTEYLTANITDLIKAAEGEEISIEVASAGAICLVDEIQSGFNGVNAGFASYIEVVDAVSVDVSMLEATKITKNGSLVQSGAEVVMMAAGDDVVYAAPGDVIRAYTAVDASLVSDANDQYYPVLDGAAIIAVKEADVTLTKEAELNVTMYEGAQVRVGDAYNKEDGTVNLEGANSGLRFVALVDTSSGAGAAASADEFGVAITAEGSDVEVLIPADKFQNDEETIFTAVLTNLKKSNYNRKFTAKPYAKFGDAIVYGESSVERSIYQVSAGLLLNGVESIEGLEDYKLSDAVAAVLNAYVNNVGIRLNIAGGEVTASDKYTGDVLFTVDAVKDEAGTVYSITVTPVETEGAAYVIDKDIFLENVRINNNNTAAAAQITNVDVDENGVLTFTFTVPAAAEQQPTEPAEG